MDTPYRDPLLCARPSQEFHSTAHILTYLSGLVNQEGSSTREGQLRDSLVSGIYSAVERFRQLDYPYIVEGADLTYTLNMATFQAPAKVDGEVLIRSWRKLKLFLYEDDRLPAIHVFEANIMLPL